MKLINLFLVLFIFVFAFGAMGQRRYVVERQFNWHYQDSVPSKELEKRAKNKDGKAMNDYGHALLNFSNVKQKNFYKGFEWIYKASQQGVPKAMLFVIRSEYIPGYIRSKDVTKELRYEYAEKIYNSEESDCIYYLAYQWKYGIPFIQRSSLWEMDSNKTLRYLKRAAELGNKEALFDMSLMYCFGGLPYINSDNTWDIDKYPVEIDYDESYRLFKLSKMDDEDYRWYASLSFGNSVELIKLENKDRAYSMLSRLYYDGCLEAGYKLLFRAYDFKDFDTAYQIANDIASNYKDEIEDFKWMAGRIYNILSKCYRHGRGVSMDQEKADFYLDKSMKYDAVKPNELNEMFMNTLK